LFDKTCLFQIISEERFEDPKTSKTSSKDIELPLTAPIEGETLSSTLELSFHSEVIVLIYVKKFTLACP
jgi:hypothetical protein